MTMSIRGKEIEWSYLYVANIPFELPDLNSYNKASRSTYGKILANNIKQKTQRDILFCLPAKQKPLLTPVRASFFWTVKDKRKDPDNIAFAVKFIFDALVKKGILYDDNLNKVAEIHHYFRVDRKDVGVTVMLETTESAK